MPEPLSQQHPRPTTPAAKSKTDLRRGQFTPGVSNGKKPAAPLRRSTGTTRAEEAMLLDEMLGE